MISQPDYTNCILHPPAIDPIAELDLLSYPPSVPPLINLLMARLGIVYHQEAHVSVKAEDVCH